MNTRYKCMCVCRSSTDIRASERCVAGCGAARWADGTTTARHNQKQPPIHIRCMLHTHTLGKVVVSLSSLSAIERNYSLHSAYIQGVHSRSSHLYVLTIPQIQGNNWLLHPPRLVYIIHCVVFDRYLCRDSYGPPCI